MSKRPESKHGNLIVVYSSRYGWTLKKSENVQKSVGKKRYKERTYRTPIICIEHNIKRVYCQAIKYPVMRASDVDKVRQVSEKEKE